MVGKGRAKSRQRTWVPRHYACRTILQLLLSRCRISLLLPEQRRRPAPQEAQQELNPLERRGGIWRVKAEPRVGRVTAAVVVSFMAMAFPEVMAFDRHCNDSSSHIPPSLSLPSGASIWAISLPSGASVRFGDASDRTPRWLPFCLSA